MKCPVCNNEMITNTLPDMSIIDTRVFSDYFPEIILLQLKTDFICSCGTEVTTRDTANYRQVTGK